MSDESVLWSRRQLRAGYWVARVLGAKGERRDVAHASWTALPLAGEVDLDELAVAEAGLLDAGLLRAEGERLRADERLHAVCAGAGPIPFELLLGLILEASPPLWLLTAVGDEGQLAVELVPDDVVTAMATVIEDPARREAFLLERGLTVDASRRAELGEAGEEAVVSACRKQLLDLGAEAAAAAVRRVSLVSDELGFDVVAPRLDGSVRRLEVKATRSTAAAVRVTVTRHEVDTGRKDPDWRLVVARVGRDEEPAILGHMAATSLEPLLPEDSHDAGRWQAARLRLAVAGLVPGLPSAASAPTV
jgi:hypothetical protein